MKLPRPNAPLAVDLRRLSLEQHQRHPYGMEQGFYNLHIGGSVYRALLVKVCRIAFHGEQAQASVNQIMEFGDTTKVTAVHLLHLDEDHDRTRDLTEVLQDETTATRAKIRGLQEHQATLWRCVIQVEHQVAKSRAETKAM